MADTVGNITLQSNSRYVRTNVYQDSDENVFFGPWKPLDIPLADSDDFYTIREGDPLRMDLVAKDFYDDPELWWVIAELNDIMNPFALEVGDTLRVPSKARIIAALSEY